MPSPTAMSGGARRSPIVPGIAIGCVLGAVALGAWYMTNRIPISPGYAFVGPRIFPYGVAALFGILGLGFIVTGLRARAGASPASEPRASPSPINAAAIWVVGGFIANLIGLASVGFIGAAAIQYAMTARGFGSDRPSVDFVCGLALAVVAFLVFTRLLGVFIGPGPLWDALF